MVSSWGWRGAAIGIVCLVASGLTMPVAAQDEGSPPPLAGEDDLDLPCFDGRLRVRDLALADDYMSGGLIRGL